VGGWIVGIEKAEEGWFTKAGWGLGLGLEREGAGAASFSLFFGMIGEGVASKGGKSKLNEVFRLWTVVFVLIFTLLLTCDSLEVTR
jgi:hypothetical protein